MRKGFTLVELSIVLVIIGLLIGGILVGQSLVESAKMQSFVRQIQQFDAAGQQFKSKYKQLPGDSAIFGCTDLLDGSTGYCNNGRVEALENSDPVYYFYGETKLYWNSLFTGGFKQDNGTAYATDTTNSTVKAGVNVPKAQIGKDAGVGVYWTAAKNNNFYIVSGYIAGDNLDEDIPGISAVDAAAYDAKVDDGAGNAGNVQSGDIAGTCDIAATYPVASGSAIVCNLEINLFANGSI